MLKSIATPLGTEINKRMCQKRPVNCKRDPHKRPTHCSRQKSSNSDDMGLLRLFIAKETHNRDPQTRPTHCFRQMCSNPDDMGCLRLFTAKESRLFCSARKKTYRLFRQIRPTSRIGPLAHVHDISRQKRLVLFKRGLLTIQTKMSHLTI